MLCPSLWFYMSLRFYMGLWFYLQQKQDKLIHVNIRIGVWEVKYPVPTFPKFPIPTPESDPAFPKCSTP